VVLNEALVGRRYKGDDYEVTAEEIVRYADATNDRNPRYRKPDPPASPVFAIVPAFGVIMGAARDPELGADLLRLVHITEEHVVHTPLRAGQRLSVSAKLASVAEEEGGESFSIEVELASGPEVAVVVQGTMLIRGSGVRRRRAANPARGQRPVTELLCERPLRIDEDQPRRYAEASGDNNPIHLDEATARSAKLPGVIVHGMCTMAMASAGVVDEFAGGEPERVRLIAARFAKPVFPGQELRARYWEDERGYEFEVVNRAGVALLGGRAEVSR
jgi:acyl dehydratase